LDLSSLDSLSVIGVLNKEDKVFTEKISGHVRTLSYCSNEASIEFGDEETGEVRYQGRGEVKIRGAGKRVLPVTNLHSTNYINN
jgi:hypothetical protein